MDLGAELQAAQLRITELERELSFYRAHSSSADPVTSACGRVAPHIAFSEPSHELDPSAQSALQISPTSSSATSAQESFPRRVTKSKCNAGSSSSKSPRAPAASNRRNPPKSQIRTRSTSSILHQGSSDEQKLSPRKKMKREDPTRKSSNPSASATDISIQHNKEDLSRKTEKRRPPPLPVLAKSSSKKERPVIVAKCTEPLPGQTRYWTEEEHERFLEAVAEYGEKAYVAISNYVETRTPKQVRTHAQKFQMKMARLAKQSYEAGQPIEIPQGMLPIFPKIDKIQQQQQQQHLDYETHKLFSKSDQHAESPADEVKKPRNCEKSTHPSTAHSAPDMSDVLAEAASTITDVSSPPIADPYLSYIGADTDNANNTELEDAFAAKLSNTLQTAQSELCSKKHIDLSSGVSNDSSSIGTHEDEGDDDLEDLEECGDLPIASLTNFGM